MSLHLQLDDFDFNSTEIAAQKKYQIKNITTRDFIDLVDLGLPSENQWCKYNLGVDKNNLSTKDAWFGNYYAWGELEPKEIYNKHTYKFYDATINDGEITKYTKMDGLLYLQPEDDIVTKTFGKNWKIPSAADFAELFRYCTLTYVVGYQNVEGLTGILATSNKNGNKIFLPCAGMIMHMENRDTRYATFRDMCIYQTSEKQEGDNTAFGASIYQMKNAYTEKIESSILLEPRHMGMSVRPIYLG